MTGTLTDQATITNEEGIFNGLHGWRLNLTQDGINVRWKLVQEARRSQYTDPKRAVVGGATVTVEFRYSARDLESFRVMWVVEISMFSGV